MESEKQVTVNLCDFEGDIKGNYFLGKSVSRGEVEEGVKML